MCCQTKTPNLRDIPDISLSEYNTEQISYLIKVDIFWISDNSVALRRDLHQKYLIFNRF